MRLEGIEVTESSAEADIFVVPGSLELFREPHDLYQLPYFSGSEARHVFFDVSDYETQYDQPSIFIRCNLREFNMGADPNSVAFPWPVENYAECVDLPEGGFKFDVSFQGWLSTQARIDSSKSCRETPALKCDIAEYSNFCGYIYHEPEGVRRRAEFRRSMRESRVCLCPESIPGVLPYRFFEAMSAGRVPLLVGSGYKLPFKDEIPYDDLILTCPAQMASQAASIALEFVRTTPDSVIADIGARARVYWETWLDSTHWPRLMSYAVQKQFLAMGLECVSQ